MLRYTIAIVLVVGGIAVASPARAQTQLHSLTRSDARTDTRTATPAPAPRQAPLSLRKAPKAPVASMVPSVPSATISRGPTVALPDAFGRRGAEPQRAQPVERGVKTTRAVRVAPASD